MGFSLGSPPSHFHPAVPLLASLPHIDVLSDDKGVRALWWRPDCQCDGLVELGKCLTVFLLQFLVSTCLLSFLVARNALAFAFCTITEGFWIWKKEKKGICLSGKNLLIYSPKGKERESIPHPEAPIQSAEWPNCEWTLFVLTANNWEADWRSFSFILWVYWPPPAKWDLNKGMKAALKAAHPSLSLPRWCRILPNSPRFGSFVQYSASFSLTGWRQESVFKHIPFYVAVLWITEVPVYLWNGGAELVQ